MFSDASSSYPVKFSKLLYKVGGFPRPLKVFALVAGIFVAAAVQAATVKMSNSGLCHSEDSGWYEQTKNYTAFGSVEACLDAGGKLPEGMSLSSVSGANGKLFKGQRYERKAFGDGWEDANGDCQDSRAEALISTSSTPVHFATDRHCRVVAGRWISPYTSLVVQSASDIDIDHVVPLAWAWERGARRWSDEKRQRFANDPINLWPVEDNLNQSKGARGPDEWLPPRGQCGYVARFFRVVKLYNLKPKSSEIQWTEMFIEHCRSQ